METTVIKKSPAIAFIENTAPPQARAITIVNTLMGAIQANLDRHCIEPRVFMAGVALAVQKVAEGLDGRKLAVFQSNFDREVARFAAACANMGLVPGGEGMGRLVAAVPRFQFGQDWTPVGVTLCAQPEWRGVLELIRRANPMVASIEANIVFVGDTFRFDALSNRVTAHEQANPLGDSVRLELSADGFDLPNIHGGYSVVRFTDGSMRTLLVTKKDIMRSIAASDTMRTPKGKQEDRRGGSPWVLHTDPMTRKSIFHATARRPDVWGGVGIQHHHREAIGAALQEDNRALGNNPVRALDHEAPVDALTDLIGAFKGGHEKARAFLAKHQLATLDDVVDKGLGEKFIADIATVDEPKVAASGDDDAWLQG